MLFISYIEMAPERVRIRRFTPRDLACIESIESECFGEEAWPREEFLHYARTCPALFLVAVERDRVIGYSITSMLRVNAELASIAIRPASRNRGVARSLLYRSMNGARGMGASALWLTVRPQNADALRLYRGMGFRSRGIIRGYYEDGGDGRRMFARL